MVHIERNKVWKVRNKSQSLQSNEFERYAQDIKAETK